MSNITPKQRGDTLVEVLISVAIVGLVLGAAYAIASKSLRQGQEGREHTAALGLLEGQIETLKYRAQGSAAPADFDEFNGQVASAPANFCLDPNANGSGVGTWDPLVNPNPATAASTTLVGTSYYAPASPGGPTCKVLKGGVTYYINIAVSKLPSGSPAIAKPTYFITATWYRIGGGIDQTKIYYRF